MTLQNFSLMLKDNRLNKLMSVVNSLNRKIMPEGVELRNLRPSTLVKRLSNYRDKKLKNDFKKSLSRD